MTQNFANNYLTINTVATAYASARIEDSSPPAFRSHDLKTSCVAAKLSVSVSRDRNRSADAIAFYLQHNNSASYR